MRYLSALSIILALSGTGVSFAAQAENATDTESSVSASEVEGSEAGIIVLREFTRVGEITQEDFRPVDPYRRGTARVESRIHRVLGESVALKAGVAIEVESPRSGSGTTFLDEDEVPALLEALDYLANIRPDVTRFKNFEVEYRTKSGFRVRVFSDKGRLLVIMRSGGVPGAFEQKMLGDFKKLIIAAIADLRQE